MKFRALCMFLMIFSVPLITTTLFVGVVLRRDLMNALMYPACFGFACVIFAIGGLVISDLIEDYRETKALNQSFKRRKSEDA